MDSAQAAGKSLVHILKEVPFQVHMDNPGGGVQTSKRQKTDNSAGKARLEHTRADGRIKASQQCTGFHYWKQPCVPGLK